MRCQGAAPLPSGGAALSGAPPQRVDRRALSALLGNFSVDRVVFRIDFLYHHVDDAGVRSGMFMRASMISRSMVRFFSRVRRPFGTLQSS